MVSQMLNYRFSVGVEVLWEPNFLGEDHFEHLIGVFVHEWTPAYHHLVNEHSEAVPIDCLPMTLVL